MGIIAVALAGAAWWYAQSPASYAHKLVGADSVSVWTFPGSHTEGGLSDGVRANIQKLEGQLHNAEGEPTDYSIYVSIANQYTLLGDGANAYKYLLLALAIDSEKTGLAWYNLGSLMERLGALETARDAYGRAVEAQPHVEQYHVALIEFLIKSYPKDTSAIEASFAGAESNFQSPSIYQIQAPWLESEGRIESAIAIWENMQKHMPANDPMILKEIARLRARL